jgi:hypothetical protein
LTDEYGLLVQHNEAQENLCALFTRQLEAKPVAGRVEVLTASSDFVRLSAG